MMKMIGKVNIGIDIGMTLLLLFLMGYQFWGDTLHEWAGALMFVLFILHHGLNFRWYRGLGKGRMTIFRTVQLFVNVLLFIAMLGLMISGIWLSNHVFAFLPIHGGLSFARILHMVSAYWGFVLMSLHLGMHWAIFVGMAKKHLRGRTGQKAWFSLSVLIAAYGLYAFSQRGLFVYLYAGTQFVFFDFSESPFEFYLDYLAMMGAWIFIAHHGMRCIRALVTKRKGDG